MKYEVLISTMNLENNSKLIKEMNITSESITINQYNTNPNQQNILKGKNKLFNYNEKGLSKSRNRALEHSTADICIIADDDMIYDDNYIETIEKAYEDNPTADIIAFYVDDENKNMQKPKMKAGRIGYLKSMKLQSVQITFKRKSIIDNNIRFDEQFGAGTKWYMGEENIFLFDCLKKKLKIYNVPNKIATLKDNESTWFKEYDEHYFYIKGTAFKRLSKKMYKLLNLQFAIRKRKLYKEKYGFIHILKKMMEGSREYGNGKK